MGEGYDLVDKDATNMFLLKKKNWNGFKKMISSPTKIEMSLVATWWCIEGISLWEMEQKP